MNKKSAIVIGVISLALITGVIAYFLAEISIDNPFKTKHYAGEIVEKFTPENDWEPGEEITKEVFVKNSGEYDIYARVKMSEKWERNGSLISGTNFDSSQDLFYPKDSLTSKKNGSSVYKKIVNTEESTGSWLKGVDGWYYYKTAISPNNLSDKLLESVTLCLDTNMGKYEQANVKYAVVPETKAAETLTDEDYKFTEPPETIESGKVLYQKVNFSLGTEKGLADAEYTLTVITEIIQASNEVAKARNWTYNYN